MDDITTCDAVRDVLGAYLDDELPLAAARTITIHLEGCAACRRACEATAAVGRAVRHGLPRHAAPDLLRSRVVAALRDARDRDARLTTRPNRRTFSVRQVAAGLLIAIASSAVTRLAMLRHGGPDLAATDIVATHVRSLMTHRLVDVVSTDEHNVKPWFDGRVPFAPVVIRLDSAGFPLIGGRVDSIGRTPVAALVYGRRKHVIDLFTWPADSARDNTPRNATEHGYNVICWSHNDMQYAAVSDAAMSDLQAFVDAFRQLPTAP